MACIINLDKGSDISMKLIHKSLMFIPGSHRPGVHNLDESRGHIKFSKVIAGRIEIVIKHAAAGPDFFWRRKQKMTFLLPYLFLLSD